MKRLILLLCLLPLIFSVADTTSAGGGIITDGDKHMRMTALDVRYIVDREARTITAEIQQTMRGASEHYVWLFPVPDDKPIVELGGGGFRSPFRTVNSPSFRGPINPCGDVYNYSPSYGSGGDGTSPIIAIETNDQVIDGESITQWLNDNNFTYQPEQMNIIEDYAGQGMSFVAVEYTINVIEGNRADLGFFTPIRITYHADAIILPLRLTAFSVGSVSYYTPNYPPSGTIFSAFYYGRVLPGYSRIPVRITIEDDGRYLPTTFPNIPMDYTRLRSSHAIAYWESDYRRYAVGMVDYLRNRSEILRELNGQAFFTDYAGVPQEGAPYTTELYAEIPSTSMTQDIHFVYMPDAENTPTEIDLGEYVDPLDFWGCSTRTLRSNGEMFELGVAVDYDDIEKDLPDGFSWMERDPIWTTGLAIRHPEDWVYSELEFPTVRGLVRAYSPEKVTLEMILDYFNGEDTPPMLLYIPTVTVDFSYFPELPFDAVSIEQNQSIRLIRRWLYPQGTGFAEWIVLLAGEEDFYQNRAMYEAMVAYPFTFRYLLHPELEHTLFFDKMGFAFPEGWIDRMEDDEHMIISPEGMDDIESTPYVRLYPASDVAPPIDRSEWETYEDYIQLIANWLATNFNVDSAFVLDTLLTSSYCTEVPMFSFSANGRTGYIQYRLYDGTLVEMSAPDEIYAENANLLEDIEEGYRFAFACG